MERLFRLSPLLIPLVSAATLGAAFGFQHLGGLAPCDLCIYQRWPYAIVIALGAMAFAADLGGKRGARDALILVSGLAFAVGGTVAIYHVGVEQDWWQGPTTCTAGSTAGLSLDELRERILNTPVVRCDDIPWSLLGISMAGYNALLSFAFAAFSFAAYRWNRKSSA